MKKINHIILHSHPQAKLFNQAWQRRRVLEAWSTVIGGFVTQASELTQAMEFKSGKLFVACLSRAVAHQIISLAKKIINAINELLGRVVVYTLSVEC